MVPHIQTFEFKERANIFTGMFHEKESIKADLISCIKEQGDQQYHKTNVKADMTRWTMYDNPHFKKIIDFAIELLEEGLDPVPQGNFYATDCWGAIYKRGGETLPHAHHPALWSFCYYVDASEECAPLVFPTAERAIQPEPGLIVIFPGWVTHMVPIQETDFERVIVSGNLTMERPQAT